MSPTTLTGPRPMPRPILSEVLDTLAFFVCFALYFFFMFA